MASAAFLQECVQLAEVQERDALHDVACLAQHGGVQGTELPEHNPQAVDVGLLRALLTYQLLCITASTQSDHPGLT